MEAVVKANHPGANVHIGKNLGQNVHTSQTVLQTDNLRSRRGVGFDQLGNLGCGTGFDRDQHNIRLSQTIGVIRKCQTVRAKVI